MNKEAFLLGYNKGSADISKVAFQQAYMTKQAAGSNWNPLNWRSNLWGCGKGKIVDYAKKEAMKKMMPLLFGGMALAGGAGMLFGGAGKGKQPAVNQTVNGPQPSPNWGMAQQQGSFQTYNPAQWKGQQYG